MPHVCLKSTLWPARYLSLTCPDLTGTLYVLDRIAVACASPGSTRSAGGMADRVRDSETSLPPVCPPTMFLVSLTHAHMLPLLVAGFVAFGAEHKWQRRLQVSLKWYDQGDGGRGAWLLPGGKLLLTCLFPILFSLLSPFLYFLFTLFFSLLMLSLFYYHLFTTPSPAPFPSPS